MSDPEPIRRPREAPFTLPFGIEDGRGGVHRDGTLRLPTQDDLIVVLRRADGVDNPAYLEKLLLARMLVRVGNLVLNEVTREEIIGTMVLPDVDHLNDVFRRLVGETSAGPVIEGEEHG